MTKKLYYEEVKLTKWDTHIKRAFEKNGHFYAILEETAFYPEGGGQPCDSGTIAGIKVLNVTTENDEILHQVTELPSLGEVHCELDWDRRYDHMQHHSGQHLLSAVCRELFDAKTVSFHLGSDYVTIDIEATDWETSDTDAVEKLANKYIYQNRQLTSYFISETQLKELPVVKMPKVTENIRIVEMEGIEYNACGGTHVDCTGEIGMIKIVRAEKQKNQTRLYFKCGYRALSDYSASLEILAALGTKFNTGRIDILDRVEKWEAEQKLLAAENEKLKEENAAFLAESLITGCKESLLPFISEEKSLKELQILAAQINDKTSKLLVFASRKESKILLSHNGSHDFHCGQFLKQHVNEFNGKGGGNNKSAQAGFSSPEDMMEFYEFCSQNIN